MAVKDIYELHFFPGANLLEVRMKSNGTVVETFPAKGGDPAQAGKPGGWELTNTGTFTIEIIEPHRSGGRWPLSTISWGTTVRINLINRGVYVRGEATPRFTISETYFNSFYADNRDVQQAIRNGDSFVNVPYYLNDFGHVTIKMYHDKNNNGRRDKNEPISSHFMHTTQWSELAKRQGEEDTYQLTYSHGCIHVKPSHIDELISKYIVKGKTKMTIHPY